MKNPIIDTYNNLIFNYNTLSYSSISRLHLELTLLSYSLYLKNILKDPRSIVEIKDILQEELLHGRCHRHFNKV